MKYKRISAVQRKFGVPGSSWKKQRKLMAGLIITARIRSMTGRYCFHRCLSVNISGGGYLVSDFQGGNLVSDFWGGVPGLRFSGGGYLVSDFRGEGGYPVLVKGKIFDSRFGLIHVQAGKKKFLLRDPPPPAIARKLLWLHGGRYASCVHAGGLSCSELLALSFVYT